MNRISDSGSIGIGAIFQYIAAATQLLSGTIFYVIITRLFSTTAVGAIALFVAINGMFNIIFQIGLGSAAQHFVSFYIGRGDLGSAKKVVKKITSFGIVLAITSFVTVSIFSLNISMVFLHSATYIPLVRFLGLVIAGNVVFGVLNGSLLGMQKFKLAAILNIMVWITYYLTAIILSIYSKALQEIILGWTIGIFSGVALELFFIFKELFGHFSYAVNTSAKHIFSYSTPILLSSVIGYGASYADRFVVAGLMSLSQLGIYNFALLIATSINFIISPFSNMLLPKFSEWYGRDDKEKLRDSFRLFSLLLSYIFVPSALGIVAVSSDIISILAGSQYISSEFPLDIIAVSGAVFVSNSVIIQAITSIRKTSILVVSSIVSLVANVAVSLTLIPIYGTIGAALGFVSIYASNFIILYVYASKLKLTNVDIMGLIKIWVSSLLMFVVVKEFSIMMHNSPILTPAYIVIGIIVYILISKVSNVFTELDKESILSLFPLKNSRIRLILYILVSGTPKVS